MAALKPEVLLTEGKDFAAVPVAILLQYLSLREAIKCNEDISDLLSHLWLVVQAKQHSPTYTDLLAELCYCRVTRPFGAGAYNFQSKSDVQRKKGLAT